MKNYMSTGITRLTAVTLVFAVLLSSSMFVLAAPGTRPMSAEIIVSGSNNNIERPLVLLNGEQALSGRTFQSSGVISTSELGSAVINLGKLGRITMFPGSTLNLSFAENSISGDLSAGQIKVLNSEGVAVNIRTTDNAVTNDAAQSNMFTIDVRSGTTQTFAENGSVFMKNGPVQKQDDDDDDDDGGIPIWLPYVIIGGLVAATIVLTQGDDNNVTSPVR